MSLSRATSHILTVALLWLLLTHIALAHASCSRTLRLDPPTHVPCLSPAQLDSCFNLARLYDATGETAKAIPLYKRELTGCAKHYGPMHNETKTSAFNLANYLEKVGETAAAEELVKEYALHAEAAEAAAAESK